MASLQALYQNPAIQNGTTSFEIQQALSDETGSGLLVFNNGPTLNNPTFTGSINVSNLTANGTVTLPTTTSIGNVSSTELGFLDGVTNSIQTQLNSKLSQSGTLSLFNATGNAPVYACRAWALVAGGVSNTFELISGGNISTVTRNTAGTYVFTLSTALTDANYSVIYGGRRRNQSGFEQAPNLAVVINSSSQFTIYSYDDDVNNLENLNFLHIAVFR